jgi:SRSO17 transposase
MGALTAPGLQEKRFAAYIDGLAKAAGHADRERPLTAYCAGLLLPGERKSVEPMAARLAPDNVRRTHQSLHHLVAAAPWSDEALLEKVRQSVLPRITRQAALAAWIVDDTSFVKKGRHSVGVARQYCGAVGKQENCQVAVSLSVATDEASLPIAWRLYLPERWVQDGARREEAGVPDEIGFQTKPAIALEQIRRSVEQEVPGAPVLADSAYGNDTQFREGITELGLPYVVGIHETTTVWLAGEAAQPQGRRGGRGRPARRLRRERQQQPPAVKELARALPPQAWKSVAWREGVRGKLRSRFAALRVRAAHGGEHKSQARREEWLLIEWPKGEAQPTHYWLSTLPAKTGLKALVKLAKQRWIIERDYEELKQELGLGHYEGRGWRGFHHHATLCIAAYGFLVIERSFFPPSARVGGLELRAAGIPAGYQPRGSPGARRTA